MLTHCCASIVTCVAVSQNSWEKRSVQEITKGIGSMWTECVAEIGDVVPMLLKKRYRQSICRFLKTTGESFLLGDRQRHFQDCVLSHILAGFFKERYFILALITADCLSSPERVILVQSMMLLWRLVALRSRLGRAFGDHPYTSMSKMT